jgi:hypothetical protein
MEVGAVGDGESIPLEAKNQGGGKDSGAKFSQ